MKSTRTLFVSCVLFSLTTSALASTLTYRLLLDSLGSGSSSSRMASGSFLPSTPTVNTPIATIINLQNSVQDIVESKKSAVVNIVISRDIAMFRSDPFGFFMERSGTVRRTVGGGTGFFINTTGLLLTNKHVANDAQADYTIITVDGAEYSGKLVAVDPTTDIALMQVFDAENKPLQNTPTVSVNAEVNTIRPGDFVIAIGNALARFQNTITFGIVSGLGRSIVAQSEDGGENLSGLIQTDTAINPGNSGGPLINLKGEVIGINTAIASEGNGVGFAIPITATEISYLTQSVGQFGRIRRSFVGIEFVSLTTQLAKSEKISRTT
jgi:serine protease Do